MKAITIIQPWASLIAHGQKRYETRSWSTSYRGLIAIHAGRRTKQAETFIAGMYDEADEYSLDSDDVHNIFFDLGLNAPDDYPFSSLIAVGHLAECVRTEHGIRDAGLQEIEFGDWSPGRYAWRIDNVWRFDRPIPIRGAQGLWDIPDDVAHAIVVAMNRKEAADANPH